MMQLASLAVALSAISSSFANPITPIDKREVGGVLICTGINATGPCKYDVYPLDQCHQLADPWHGNTNTFLVDGDDFECSPHTYDCQDVCKSPTGCTFGAVDWQYENRYDLSAIGWDSLFMSFQCRKKEEPSETKEAKE